MSELELIRRELNHKNPACAVRAAPVRHGGAGRALPTQSGVHGTVTGLRPRPAPALAQPTRLERFNSWRKAHYVADQLLRVACIAVGAAVALLIVASLVVALIGWLLGQVSATAGGSVGVIVLLAAAALFSGRSGGGHGGHSGHGFHWTKCK